MEDDDVAEMKEDMFQEAPVESEEPLEDVSSPEGDLSEDELDEDMEPEGSANPQDLDLEDLDDFDDDMFEL